PSRELHSLINVLYNLLSGFLAGAHYVGSGEPKHRNAITLENAVAPPIIARLVDATLMELMTVGFDRDHGTTLIQTGHKYSEIYIAHRIDPQLRNESEQPDLVRPSFR